MGDSGDGQQQEELEWTCCNDKQSLFILLYIAFASIACITLRTDVAKPLRLIATFLHELSHATACWLTGGQVKTIRVFQNEGGVTQYSGGWRCLIIPAGYIGCSFWAMVFVILSGGRVSSTIAAVGFIISLLLALCYSPNRTMVILNLGYSILLILFLLVDWFVYTPLLQFVILFFGVFVGIIAVSDIHSDTILRSVEGSDSHACTQEVWGICPPRCIGLQWILYAVFFQLFGIWIALVEMSNECVDLGWFQCLHVSIDLDWEWDGLDHVWADYEGFWDNPK